MRIAAALLMLLTLSCRTAPNGIDGIVSRTLETVPDMPSVGVAIVRDGKPYYANAYGYADLESKTRAGRDTAYYIASSTKSYTGLACAILAERGLIDLDAPITKVLPEVKLEPPLDAGRITLRQFLTHTPGIKNDAIVFRTAFSGQHTPAQLVALLDSSRPQEPGFHYDNLGYVVASLVIERVTGKPWQKVLDEIIFTPLGMNRTTAYMSEARQWPMATPYTINRKGEIERVRFVKNDQMMHAAGGMVTTPADLTRWLAANLAGTSSIPASAFREAQRQQVAATMQRDRLKAHGYGFGWFLARLDGTDEVLFHGGGFVGWRAYVSFMPEKRIGIALVTNSNELGALGFLMTALYDHLLEKPGAEATFERNLATLKETQAKDRRQFLAGIEQRSKRTWQLQHPNGVYTGAYENPLYGTLRIEEREGRLVASLAQMSAVLEAFTEPETARLELVPGSGEVLRFTFNGDAVQSVKWGDEVFRRVN